MSMSSGVMPRSTRAFPTCGGTPASPCTDTRSPVRSTRCTPVMASRKPTSVPTAVKVTVTPSEWASTSSAGVPVATTRPAATTASRSQSRSASSMKCVTSTTVVPRARMRSTSSQVERRAAGSSPVVISSRKTTCGSFTRARATSRRWRCPPDRLPKAAFSLASSPQSCMTERHGGPPAWKDEKSASASPTRRRWGSEDSCSWAPVRWRRADAWLVGSRPSTSTRPASGVRSPCTHSTEVVFPAPFGPRIPKISPWCTSNETSATASSSP